MPATGRPFWETDTTTRLGSQASPYLARRKSTNSVQRAGDSRPLMISTASAAFLPHTSALNPVTTILKGRQIATVTAPPTKRVVFLKGFQPAIKTAAPVEQHCLSQWTMQDARRRPHGREWLALFSWHDDDGQRISHRSGPCRPSLQHSVWLEMCAVHVGRTLQADSAAINN